MKSYGCCFISFSKILLYKQQRKFRLCARGPRYIANLFSYICAAVPSYKQFKICFDRSINVTNSTCRSFVEMFLKTSVLNSAGDIRITAQTLCGS